MLKNKFNIFQLHELFLISIIIFIFFSKFLNSLITITFFSYFDEFLLAYIFLVLIYSLVILKINKFIVYIFFFILYMIVISIYNNNSNIQNILIQSIIHMKFFIFYFLFDKYLTSKGIQKVLSYLFIITIFGFIFHLLLQQTLNNFTGQAIDYRSGLLRIGGFQVSPNLLGITFSMYYLYYLFKNRISFFKAILISILFSLIILLTGSRVALIAIIIGIFFFYISQKNKSKIYILPIVVLFFFVFLYLIIQSDIGDRTVKNFSMLSDPNSGYIRGIMLYFGLELFIDNFPIGTGAATFGSLLSEGSPVYEQLGLSNKSFFINMSGIYDSNIASIMGEFGFVGILFFILILKYIYNKIVNKDNKYYLLSIIIFMTIASFVNPIFMNAYFATLFALFLVYIKKNKEKFENINHK